MNSSRATTGKPFSTAGHPVRGNPEGRWRAFTYDELLARDKVSLDIFWLKDESLEDNASLPALEVIAAEIMDDLCAALEQFAAIAGDLGIEE